MIKAIEIQKFKKFKNPIKIEGLSKVNYLVGKNNSGKTSFLEAILLSTLYRNESGERFINPRLSEIFAKLKEYFYNENLNDPIKVIFSTDAGDVEIKSELRDGENILKAKTGNGKIPKSLYIPCGIKIGLGRDNSSFNVIDNQIKSSGILPIENIGSWVYHQEKDIVGDWTGGKSLKFQKLEKIMKDWFFVDILQPVMNHDNQFYFKYQEEGKKRNLYLSGAGAQNIIYLIAVIAYIDNYDLILIDEPELHLHPEIQKKLGEIFRNLSNEFNLQFIIANQSPFIISKLTADDNIYIFNQKENHIIKKEESFINTAVAMEIGGEPSDVGAPENFILTEESSIEILLKKINERFFHKNIQFIACSGSNHVLDEQESIKNIINHNKLLKCTPIYLDKYFIVVDKLTDTIQEKEELIKIKNKLGERFIELDQEKIEDIYPDTHLENFITEDNSDFINITGESNRERIEKWIEERSYPERGK